MTLLVVFRADDGLLACADGRRSVTHVGESEGVPQLDDACKSFATRVPPAVMMAAGRAHLGGMVVADVMKLALQGLVGSIDGTELAVERGADSRGGPTVLQLAEACFSALKTREAADPDAGRVVMGVTVGIDAGSLDPSVYEFMVGEQCTEPAASEVFARDGLLVLPMLDGDDEALGHLVRERFGFNSPATFTRLLDDYADDPGNIAFQDPGYALTGKRLDEVAEAVCSALPALISEHEAEFDEAGVGGVWSIYEIRTDQPVKVNQMPWGPMRVDQTYC